VQDISCLFTAADNLELGKDIEEDEVLATLLGLEPDKAPRPDGFTIFFLRACWHIIKLDLCKMLSWTRIKQKVGGGTNSSFPHEGCID